MGLVPGRIVLLRLSEPQRKLPDEHALVSQQPAKPETDETGDGHGLVGYVSDEEWVAKVRQLSASTLSRELPALQRAVGNSAISALLGRSQPAGPVTVARTPATAAPPAVDRLVTSTTLPLAGGGRQYVTRVLQRGNRAVISVELVGAGEHFETILSPSFQGSLVVHIGETVIGPDQSSLQLTVAGAKGGSQPCQVTVVPSPYQAAGRSELGDRVNVSDGARSIGKDVYPTGASTRLSPSDARFSTVVQLPASGSATQPASVVVEVAPSPDGHGASLVINLQKTGQRVVVPIEGVDVVAGPTRLLKEGVIGKDAVGSPLTQVELEVPSPKGGAPKVVQLTFASLRHPNAGDENYTSTVTDLATQAQQSDGFAVPASPTGKFHYRVMTAAPTVRETLSGDQEFNAVLRSPSGTNLDFGFRRSTPTSAVEFIVSAGLGAISQTFSVPYNRTAIRPRIVQDTGGETGQLTISLEGGQQADLVVTWEVGKAKQDIPFLEGVGHIVLRPVSTSSVRIVVAGIGIDTWSQFAYSPALPDEAIVPPKWRMTQVSEVGWLRLSDHQFIPLRLMGPQVAGAELAKIFGQELVIAYVHAIPIVGELVMIGEAIAGREIVTGRRLSPGERTLLAALGGLGLLLTGAGAMRGLGKEAEEAALATGARNVSQAAGVSEDEARALVRAATTVSEEDRVFLAELREDLRAGRQIEPARLQRFRSILETVNQEAQARRGVVDLLQARQEQIEAARGDLNIFRGRFRRLSAAGNAPQDLAQVAAQLDELLTPYRRVQVVAGGGRAGGGVSTYIESLDGRFSVRITHNQVGPHPVGNPAAPRIHLYEGPVTGHGSHVVLPDGTTLEDILRALRLGP